MLNPHPCLSVQSPHFGSQHATRPLLFKELQCVCVWRTPASHVPGSATFWEASLLGTDTQPTSFSPMKSRARAMMCVLQQPSAPPGKEPHPAASEHTPQDATQQAWPSSDLFDIIPCEHSTFCFTALILTHNMLTKIWREIALIVGSWDVKPR